MKTKKGWFEVSQEGLRALQAGKPKHYILRELVQNAWDENISRCEVIADYSSTGKCTLSVEDDSPEGFRNLEDAFTLFAPTYKRSDPNKRGRFNLGEKQALAVCDWAKIETTKGTIIFDKDGRHVSSKRRESGSKVSVEFSCPPDEYKEMIGIVRYYIPPKGIVFTFNGEGFPLWPVFKKTEAVLPTEYQISGQIKCTKRKTDILIMERHMPIAYLYEMGLPICEIECDYSINIMQKVPLSADRESVTPAYLKLVFAEVLNATHTEVLPEESSQVWVRQAMASDKIQPEAVRDIINKRFGEKAAIATPSDPNSIDEAMTQGYKVVYGSELSREEWDNVKKFNVMESTGKLFGVDLMRSEPVQETEAMERVRNLVKKIARFCFDVEVSVQFRKWPGTVAAQYGNRTLTFNISVLGSWWFNPVLSAEILDLIMHELAHEAGNHTEHSYHEALTSMAGKLIIKALEDPVYFRKY